MKVIQKNLYFQSHLIYVFIIRSKGNTKVFETYCFLNNERDISMYTGITRIHSVYFPIVVPPFHPDRTT